MSQVNGVDENTKRYINSEFAALDWSADDDGWRGAIQVRASHDGTTKWLSITQAQAEKIMQILIDG